jgi:hypothetical protein
MMEIHRNRPRLTVEIGWIMQGKGNLDKPLSPNEICMEGGAQRIPSPTGTGNFFTDFPYNRIIHMGNNNLTGAQLFQANLQRNLK